MKKSRLREEQVIGILKQHESGVKTGIFAGSTESALRRSTRGSKSSGAWA
jgi:hypothetical protein